MNRLYQLDPKLQMQSNPQEFHHTSPGKKLKAKKNQMISINQPRYATHSMTHPHTHMTHNRGHTHTGHGYSSRIHNH